MEIMPQFPLGTVLLPSMVLPLHIFEPRYRDLMTAVVPERREFGVTLIERGAEVGGGEVRTMTGTVARIVEAEEFDDGRWLVVIAGTRRFRVAEWLPDDPYPVASIEDWPDEPTTVELSEDVAKTIGRFKRCLATASEAGHNVGPIPEIAEEAVDAIEQLAVLSPVSQLDRQRFLEAVGPQQRLTLIDQALADAQEMFDFELMEG